MSATLHVVSTVRAINLCPRGILARNEGYDVEIILFQANKAVLLNVSD